MLPEHESRPAEVHQAASMSLDGDQTKVPDRLAYLVQLAADAKAVTAIAGVPISNLANLPFVTAERLSVDDLRSVATAVANARTALSDALAAIDAAGLGGAR